LIEFDLVELDRAGFGMVGFDVTDFDPPDLGLALAAFDLSDGAALVAAGPRDRAIRFGLRVFRYAPTKKRRREHDHSAKKTFLGGCSKCTEGVGEAGRLGSAGRIFERTAGENPG
jgi:hypothetical protein